MGVLNPGGRLLASVLSSSASIDLCRAPYGVLPGEDVTAALQSAIEAVVKTGLSGEVYFSVPGVYHLYEAPKTGEALGYKYAGQVLFPAAPLSSSLAVTIRGCVRPSSGGPGVGMPNGV
ncbi:MAG TPA: hypothetical protein VNL71_03545, partial [Chloroflexota bacterium]|nr:hypothetical protein [Chloroflexota bacterium]